MTKVILNKGYGGFSISAQAHKLYAEKLGKELFYYVGEITKYIDCKVQLIYTRVSYEEFLKKKTLFYFYSFKDLGDSLTEGEFAREKYDKYELNLDESHREDPILIEVVEELSEEEASGRFSTLKIVEIPDELANGNYMIDNYEGIEVLHAKVEEY